jgi:Flp pilus assembly protein TadG
MFECHRGRRDRGANLVEFALIAPLLIILVLGIVEFGYLFAQYNEIRHGAREGARYAAVSNPDYNLDGSINASDVQDVTCDTVDLPSTSVEVSLQLNAPGQDDRLDYATITVESAATSLTGFPFITALLPATIDNSAVFRLEQNAGWSPFSSYVCP